jgi:hypothetical protein
MISELVLPEFAVGEITSDYHSSKTDHRKHPRVLLRMPVDLRKGPGIYFPAETVNVSRQGLLIESAGDAEFGSRIEVITRLHGDGDQRIAVNGKIVRLDHREAGNNRFGMELLSGDQGYQAWQDFWATRGESLS